VPRTSREALEQITEYKLPSSNARDASRELANFPRYNFFVKSIFSCGESSIPARAIFMVLSLSRYIDAKLRLQQQEACKIHRGRSPRLISAPGTEQDAALHGLHTASRVLMLRLVTSKIVAARNDVLTGRKFSL